MINIIEDVSTLTNVSETTLKKFTPVIVSSIGHAVHEGLCEHKDIIEIDLEIGELHIKTSPQGIHYRFVPSKELEKTLVNTVTTRTSPILITLQSNLQEKIDCAYKEIL